MPVRTDPIVSYWIPKPSGGNRRMAILSEPDAVRWHQVAVRVAATLEPRLGFRVLANRVRLDREGLTIGTLRPALRRARDAAGRLVVNAAVLVRTDVTAFYPSVTPSVTARSLVGIGAEPADARLAADLVDGWGSEGYAGLPIGPPGSAVLANAILHPVDEALGPVGFLRWVDDYLIACRSEAAAGSALGRLDDALAPLGLLRSASKTRVLGRDRSLRWPGAVSLAEPDGRPSPCR